MSMAKTAASSRCNPAIFLILLHHHHLLLLLLLLTPSATGADPDLLQDFCVADLHSRPLANGFSCVDSEDVGSQDFVFSGLRHGGNTSGGTGFAGTLATVLQFPALNTQGISMARADFAPGGVNVPHVHPRASELLMVLEGRFYAGFVSTSNRVYARVVEKGEVMIIPRGLVHFQMNVGSSHGVVVGAMNSQNPGIQRLPAALFGSEDIQDEVLQKAFQLSREAVDALKANLKPKP